MTGRLGDWRSVKVVVPQNTDIIPGRWYRLDGFIGIAFERVTTGAGVTSKAALGIETGQYELDATEINVADAFGLGDDVYFEDATGLFRSVAHAAAAPAGSHLIGRVTLAKDANNAVWFARTRIDT